MSLLSIRDLRVSFGAVEAVKGISFDVPEHTTVALVGESGSGKSVTALSILGLLPRNALTRGEILFEGRNVPGKDLRGAQLSMIFQEPMSSLNPVFTVGFQIGEALRASRHAARKRSIELLDEVGLSNPEAKLERYPFQLSGGEQQRVMIAMAIACEPKLLIADEPTSALDVTVQKQILELIAALQRRRRMSMLFITHDLALVKQVAEQVVVMRAGEIREQGSVAQVFGSPRQDYTRMLLDARPRMDQAARARRSTETILEARGLAKSFDRHQAVKGASFKLSRGRTLGLVGESG
ncbi:MAG TPA: ATP-binding cassette domain-containing protein, partial [Burkholderiales bacterium]|nr:ATP-binding cassette domain-containing protein [Burkholderiales bacterium]